MATDATGTPTTLGIPTYNTNVDAPSGNGNNAQMQKIDALLQLRATLASPAFTGTPTAPTPGAGDNTTKLATTAFVAALAALLVPTGSIMPYGGSAAPSASWLIADGSAVSRTTYATLFGVIGSTYGAGDGSTTFNIPDMRGRVALGAGTAVGANGATAHTLGAMGGEETHALLNAEMPVHNHGGQDSSVSAGTPSGSLGIESQTHTHGITMSAVTLNFAAGGSSLAVMTNTGSYNSSAEGTNHSHTFSGNALAGHAHTISNDGGGGAHNNLQPFTVVNHIIKT